MVIFLLGEGASIAQFYDELSVRRFYHREPVGMPSGGFLYKYKIDIFYDFFFGNVHSARPIYDGSTPLAQDKTMTTTA